MLALATKNMLTIYFCFMLCQCCAFVWLGLGLGTKKTQLGLGKYNFKYPALPTQT